MRNRKFAVGQECRELLQQAAEKRVPMTLTRRVDNTWQVYKTQFLAIQGNRLLFSEPIPDENVCPMELASGQVVAIAFKKGYNKCLFTTRVVGQEQYELESGELVPGMKVFAPQQIEKIQRRTYNRAEVPESEEVLVTMTRENGKSWQGKLFNLSAGGIGVVVTNDQQPELGENEIHQVSFKPMADQRPIEVEVRFRHADMIEGTDRVMLGFQLLGLEATEEGRQVIRRIGRIVSVYERKNELGKHQDLRR